MYPFNCRNSMFWPSFLGVRNNCKCNCSCADLQLAPSFSRPSCSYCLTLNNPRVSNTFKLNEKMAETFIWKYAKPVFTILYTVVRTWFYSDIRQKFHWKRFNLISCNFLMKKRQREINSWNDIIQRVRKITLLLYNIFKC